MDQVFEDGVRGRIEELKGLYAQLLVMLDQSIEEAPDEEAGDEEEDEEEGY